MAGSAARSSRHHPDSFQGIVKEPLRIHQPDGCLYCPDQPGFGVELDEDKVKDYTVLEK